MSLATRILLLIALAMLPVVAAQVFTQVELQRARESEQHADALRYARLVSSDAGRVVEGVKAILVAVSEAPFIRNFDATQCRTYLTGLAKRYPQVFNITLINAQGAPVCANTASVPGATAADRFYFQEALRTNAFIVGNHIVGRTIPFPQLPVALPFEDASGQRYVLSIGLGFDWLQRHFHQLDLPSEATLWIVDRNGAVLVGPSIDYVGKPLPEALQPMRSRPEGTFRYRDSNDASHVVGVVPSSVPPLGMTIAVDMREERLWQLAATDARRDLAILLISVLATAALASLGTRRLVSRPLQRLTSAAQRWSEGDYAVRIELADRRSEVGRLSAAFDRMADVIQADQQALQEANETLERRVVQRTAALAATNHRLESEMAERQAAEAALRQAQKMEAIGRLTGGIAHDFNNLLTAIGGSIEFLHGAVRPDDARAQRYYSLGREAVERAGRMTHRLLAFARQQPLELEAVDLNRVVAGMADLLARTLGEPIRIETALAGGLWLTRSDPAQIENALLNLAINARDAMPDGGRLTIETANVVLEQAHAAANDEVRPGQYVMLSVSDTGTGMPPEVVARAFDPFFTTKEPGRGTGLGLSMIYGFASQSGGHVKICSEPGQGTTVKLYLPCFLPAAAAVAEERHSEQDVSAPGRHTVLVVEDDAAVRDLTTAFLRELGYAVLAARDGPSALVLLRERDDVTVLFTDIVLTGGMNGHELAETALCEQPDLRVLFTTGYTPDTAADEGILDAAVPTLTKPFTAEALGAKLRSVLEQAPAVDQ